MRIVYQLVENYLSQKVPSILISIEEQSQHYKYIINVPPSHQRFIANHKMKFQKGARYFFTKTSTETIAGLTGMMLTMFENGFAYDSKLYVDKKMYEYLEAMRYKMGFKLMPYAYCSWSGEKRLGIREKETIFKIFENKAEYFKIFTNLQEYIEKNLKQQEINNPLIYYDQAQKTFKDEQIRFVPFTTKSEGEVITNFICVPNKLTGKVNAKKLKELGIEPKRIGELMKTGRLILETGQMVTVDDVKEPDQASPNFLILHFNSIQSVKQVLSHPTLNQYLQNKENFTQSVLHIVEQKDIVLSQDFKILINRFSPNVQHVIYNSHFKNKADKFEDICQTSPHMDLVSEISHQFPQTMADLNGIQEQYLKKHFENIINIEDIFPNHKFHCYKRCYEMIIAPTKNSAYQVIKTAKPQKKQLEPLNEQTSQKLKQLLTSLMSVQSYPQNMSFEQINPKIVFLGTGSMMPSKHRNVSCIFIQYLKNHSMMLDCGQGSYYQLFNHYGPELIDQMVLSTRVIFITHIHSDHNLGILDLISERIKLMKKYNREDKLFLVIPFNVLPWFKSYVEKVEDLTQGCEVVFLQWIKNQELTLSQATMSKDERKISCISGKSQMLNEKDQKVEKEQNEEQEVDMGEYYNSLEEKLVNETKKMEQKVMQTFNSYLKQIGVVEFLPVPVVHCPQSHGVVITHESKVKISYSGDTIPVEEFAKAATNSTLMIHEATFGDDLAENAKQNMHTTVGQAIDIGMKSNSWKTALTHFSQRYKSAREIVQPALYKTNEAKYDYTMNHTIVCFDHMQMRLSETPKLPHISRAIAALIPSEKTDE